MGLPNAISRYIIVSLESSDNDGVNTIFSCGLLIFLGLGIVAGAGMYWVSYYPEFFNLNSSHSNVYSSIVKFIAIKVVFDFVFNTFNAVFSAFLRIDIDSNISIFNTLFKLILIVVLITPYGLWGLLAATLIADISTQLLKAIFAKKICSYLSFDVKNINLASFKQLFHFGKYLFLMSLAEVMYKSAPAVILSKFLDLSAVAVFGIANRLIQQADAVLYAVFGTFESVFTKLVARKENIEHKFHIVTQLNLFFGTVLAVTVIGSSSIFIGLWLGEEFAKSAKIIDVLAVVFLVISANRACRQILIAQANHKLLAYAEVIGVFTGLVLITFLIPEYGIVGSAYGLLFGQLFSGLFLTLVIFYCKNAFRKSPLILRLCLSALILISMTAFSKSILGHQQFGWIQLILVSAALFLGTSFLCWFIVLSKPARQLLNASLSKKLSR
jgi:O-antigen/teichoic acid export membrane protein